MTVSEVRDRLDQRFRSLVGSRRGLERHQTLRHTVAWSFDLLEHDEKALLQRCSVFAGGFDLAGVCSVAAVDHGDEFEVLDLLSALVRKSLVVAQRSAGRARDSMLETIRQFAEEQLVATGTAADVRTAHAAYIPRPAKLISRRCGTARDSATRTCGSLPNCQISEQRSDGRSTSLRWSPPPRSSPMPRFSAALSRTSKLWRGPRNSFRPLRLLTTHGLQSCRRWRRIAGTAGLSLKMPLVTRMMP